MNTLQRTEITLLSGFNTTHFALLFSNMKASEAIDMAHEFCHLASKAKTTREYRMCIATERLYLLMATCINHRSLHS